MQAGKVLFISTIITLLFCLAITYDISPYLRGPAPYPPDWRWDYLYVNTYPRIFPALFIVLFILFLFKKSEEKSASVFRLKNKTLVSVLVFLSFLFQFAILFFNRAGIGVLLHRIINPGLNGYFTAATQIKDLGFFLSNFENIVLKLPMHATGHPPLAVLFFYFLNNLIKGFPFTNLLVQSFQPTTPDVLILWNTLLPHEQAGALISTLLIPLLSCFTIVPIYLLAKKLYGQKVAIRSSFLYLFIPGFVLFIPINDVYISIFPLFSLLFLVLGFERKSIFLGFASGLIFLIGLGFSFSLLPLLIIYIVMCLKYLKKTKFIFKIGGAFLLGNIIPLFLVYIFFGFNIFTILPKIMSGLPTGRNYFPWVIYNLYDFFVFAGIPLSIFFVVAIFVSFMKIIERKNFKKMDLFLTGFFVMIMLLNFSGSVKGEVGRIWLPFVPFMLIPVVNFLTVNNLLTKKLFVFFLILQVIQILTLNEFWVMLW